MCENLLNSNIDLGILPIENSIAGSFFGVIDLLKKHNLSIVGEFENEEHQCLVGLEGASLAKAVEIHSHPYAFDQVSDFLATVSEKKLVQSIDTASSCELIQKSKLDNVLAIASERAAKLYGLKVLQKLDSVAVTRYALVATKEVVPERHLAPRTSIEIILKNQVGAIMKAVTAFSHRDINIAKIESRPSSRSIRLQKPWEYIVYIDVDCGLNDSRMEKALNHLQELGTIGVMGSYPRYQQPVEVIEINPDGWFCLWCLTMNVGASFWQRINLHALTRFK